MPSASIFTAEVTGYKIVRDLADHVYTMYVIGVQHGGLEWCITRRYSDFLKMHQSLHSTCQSLPDFPPKRWLYNMEKEFIEERQTQLHEYMQLIMKDVELRQTVYVLSFLGALSTTLYEHECMTGEARAVVHLRVLHKYVGEGDLILFRSKDHVSSIQRSVTGSEWDHVGMVVKRPSTTMFSILEATGGNGVTICPLVRFLDPLFWFI